MSEERRIALVTGATRGLGEETAKRLAALGLHVIVAGRDRARAQAVATAIGTRGGSASALELDLGRPATFRSAAEEIAAKHGRLDVLVNNAGVMRDGSWGGNTAATIDPAVLRTTFETNFFGLVELTQVLLPLLRKSRAANVVNVSSVMGSLTVHADPQGPLAGSKPFAYDASKTALNAFTVHLAAALRDTGIQVNSAHPGWVKTELGTGAAPMSVEEGARTIVELATLAPGQATGRFMHQGQPLPW